MTENPFAPSLLVDEVGAVRIVTINRPTPSTPWTLISIGAWPTCGGT
jgi:hypothetical protein